MWRNYAYIVICFEEEDIDKALANDVVKQSFSKHGLEVVIPTLKAKKLVIIWRLDNEITDNEAEEIDVEIEKWNSWAKV